MAPLKMPDSMTAGRGGEVIISVSAACEALDQTGVWASTLIILKTAQTFCPCFRRPAPGAQPQLVTVTTTANSKDMATKQITYSKRKEKKKEG
jgi:hypothetical protein